MNRHHVTEIRMQQIGNSDHFRCSDMNRCSVNLRHISGDQYRFRNQIMRNRTHAHHHISMENTCRCAWDIGLIHGNVAALLNMANRNSCFQKISFKREAAADQKADQILSPEVRHILKFSFQLAMFIEPVFRNFFCNITSRSNGFQIAVSHISYFQNRAGSGISLGKE